MGKKELEKEIRLAAETVAEWLWPVKKLSRAEMEELYPKKLLSEKPKRRKKK